MNPVTLIYYKDGRIEEHDGALPNFSVEDEPPALFLHDLGNTALDTGGDIPLEGIRRIEVIL